MFPNKFKNFKKERFFFFKFLVYIRELKTSMFALKETPTFYILTPIKILV